MQMMPNPVIDDCDWVRLAPSSTVYRQHKHHDELALLLVDSPLCRASIALQGAQLLEFSTTAGQTLLWLSPAAVFMRGRSLRGGIPLCLPWFGQPADQPDKPQHGFLRDEDWQLAEARVEPDQSIVLNWRHSGYRDQPHPQFNWRFETALQVRLGTGIDLHLEVTNCDATPMPLSWAMHSYHPVSDLEQLGIDGLENCEYLDKTRGFERGRQLTPLRFGAEFDRIYLDVPRQQRVLTHPAIHISGDNCRSAIVWNPGPARAAMMPELGIANYHRFVCLERGNTADNSLLLAPGNTHRASVNIIGVSSDD